MYASKGGIALSYLIEGPKIGVAPVKADLERWINMLRLPYSAVLGTREIGSIGDHYGLNQDNFLIFDLKTMQLVRFDTAFLDARAAFEMLLEQP